MTVSTPQSAHVSSKNPSGQTGREASYRGDNKLILGIVLAVITFWLFAQTTLNVAPAMARQWRSRSMFCMVVIAIVAIMLTIPKRTSIQQG